MAIDTTVGGATSNSYVTLAEADAYFGDHYSIAKAATWSDLSDAQKTMALLRATQMLDSLRVLDREFGFGSMPIALVALNSYDLTIHRQIEFQYLQFPRNIDLDPDGNAFIHQEVKDAECEQAVFLVTFDEDALATQLSGVGDETLTAGSVHLRTTYRAAGSAIAPMALELMRQFLRPTNRLQRS